MGQHGIALGRLLQEFGFRCSGAFQFPSVKGEADNIGQDEQAAETLLEQEPEGEVRRVI